MLKRRSAHVRARERRARATILTRCALSTVLALLFVPHGARAQSDLDAQLDSAHQAEAQGNYAQAVSIYTQMLSNPSLTAVQRRTVFVGRGVVHGRSAEFSAAIQDFTRAIALDPKQSDAYYDRALTYSDIGKTAEALADFATIESAAAIYPDYYFNRGYVHYENNDFDLAIADLTRAAAQKPENAAIFYQRGKAYDAKAMHAEAAADFAATIKLKPAVASMLTNAYRWHGTEAFAQKQYPQAAADFSVVLKQDPQDADAAMRLGYAAFAQGHYAEAVADSSRAIHDVRAPVMPWPGVVDQTKCLPDRIVEQYNSGVREPGVDPYALVLRARANLKLGHKDSALADYAAAVRVIPPGADDSVSTEMAAARQ